MDGTSNKGAVYDYIHVLNLAFPRFTESFKVGERRERLRSRRLSTCSNKNGCISKTAKDSQTENSGIKARQLVLTAKVYTAQVAT